MQTIHRLTAAARGTTAPVRNLENLRGAYGRRESHEAAHHRHSSTVAAPALTSGASLFVSSPQESHPLTHSRLPSPRSLNAEGDGGRLNPNQILNLIAAARHAERIGAPLDVFCVIRLRDAV